MVRENNIKNDGNVKDALPIIMQRKLIVLITELVSCVNKICYTQNEEKGSLYLIIH